MSRSEALMIAKAVMKAQVSASLRRIAICYGDSCLLVDMDPCRHNQRRERRFRRLLERSLGGAR